MTFLREPRFWITVIIAGGLIAFVLTSKLSAEAGVAALVGLLLRIGADKTTKGVDR